MIIGFDGKRAARNRTGLGNYSRWLIRNLACYFPANQYEIYTPKDSSLSEFRELLSFGNIKLRLPGAVPGFLWRSLGIGNDLKRHGVRLFHGLSHEIPFFLPKGIRTIVTVHDLIFRRYPGYFKWIDRTIYDFKCRYACGHADHIIAISEQTRHDIMRYYKIPAERISVIYQSCDEGFKQTCQPEKHQEVRKRYSLPSKYILSVGTIEERKNLLVLIKALSDIDKEYKLVLIGRRKAYANTVDEEIAKRNLDGRVVFLKDVGFSDLPSIYQQAALFVYPSRFEGFGIPVLEALYSGVPVIAATGSCLEEAGGPDSKYISPDDSSQLASFANNILGDAGLAAEMIHKGRIHAENFSNQRLAMQLMDCYNNVLKN